MQHCIQLVRRHDRDHFLCALLMPNAASRRATMALRALNIELIDLEERTTRERADTHDTIEAADLRAAWWQTAIDWALNFDGKTGKEHNEISSDSNVLEATAAHRGHPVVSELRWARGAFPSLSGTWIRRLWRQRRVGLAQPIKKIDALEQYAEQTYSSLLYATLELSGGGASEAAEHAASHVGRACGLLNVVRGLPWHWKARRAYVPVDVAARHGFVEEHAFRHAERMSMCGDGTRWMPNASATNDGDAAQQPLGGEARLAVYDIASSAKLHLDHAYKLSADVEPSASRALLPALVAQHTLDRLLELQFDVYDRRLTQPAPTLQIRLAYNAFRNRWHS
jgi:NADH dehydrogenase [ubiquinone] 1 alpha subcomplex assembly factor 6